MSTLIIAEAGVNHNGDLNLAKELIEIAASSGADLVKFQTFSAERLVTQTAHKANYQISTNDLYETQHAMLKRLELSEYNHHELVAHCKKFNIGFLSTGFDIESLDMLMRLGQSMIKIPSGEVNNFPFLRHIGKLNKEVLLSTGMSSMEDISAALETLEESGTPRSKVTVLHCTTSYPLPMAEVNLRAMQSIKAAFQVSVGYSDHSLGIEVPIAATALGASVIEKHFTISRNLPGPDHKASLEPDELKLMVSSIRNIERALGDGIKKIMPSEFENILVARRSIVASVRINAGELFSESNLSSKRPGNGISPMKWRNIIGTKSNRNYEIDEIIDET